MLTRLTQLADVTWNGWLNSGSANGLLSKSDISPRRMMWVVPAECVSKLTATIKSYSERLHQTYDSCGGRGGRRLGPGWSPVLTVRCMNVSSARRFDRRGGLVTSSGSLRRNERPGGSRHTSHPECRTNIENGDMRLCDDSDYMLSDEQLLITF